MNKIYHFEMSQKDKHTLTIRPEGAIIGIYEW